MKFNKLMNNKGFTLTEVMIASGIAVIILIAGSLALLGVTKANLFIHYSADEYGKSQNILHGVPLYLGQAINTDWTANPINNIGGNRGRLRAYQSGFNATGALQAPDTVGAFLREFGAPTSADPISAIWPVALYFRNPTATREGQLIVSTENPTSGNVTLNSNDPARVYGSLVELQVRQIPGGGANGQPVRMAQVRMVLRKFHSTEQSQWRWCPQAEMGRPECHTGVKYKDVTHVLNIPFVNNTVATIEKNVGVDSSGNPAEWDVQETLNGKIYFYGLKGGTYD